MVASMKDTSIPVEFSLNVNGSPVTNDGINVIAGLFKSRSSSAVLLFAIVSSSDYETSLSGSLTLMCMIISEPVKNSPVCSPVVATGVFVPSPAAAIEHVLAS
jgi:hypothetical protein